MSVEIAWKQNILVTDFHLLKSLLFVFGFGSQAFVCGFSRQNICSAVNSGACRKIPLVTLIYVFVTYCLKDKLSIVQLLGTHYVYR